MAPIERAENQAFAMVGLLGAWRSERERDKFYGAPPCDDGRLCIEEFLLGIHEGMTGAFIKMHLY